MTEFVYLLGSEASPLVKIGRSTNVPGRLADIQRMSPTKLAVLWQTKGGAELETAFHRRFRTQRAHGEWFEFPDDDGPERLANALPDALAEAAQAKMRRKIRKVWSSPRRYSRSTEEPTVTVFAGFNVGDIVSVAREGWDGRTGVIRRIREHEESFVFVIEENDGGYHRILPLCTPAEITHHAAATEVARVAHNLPCDSSSVTLNADGTCSISTVDRRTCMCRSSDHGLHAIQQFMQDLLVT